jgi:hypothetical protein
MSVIPLEVYEKFAQEYQQTIQKTSKELAQIRGQLQAQERERKVSFNNQSYLLLQQRN